MSLSRTTLESEDLGGIAVTVPPRGEADTLDVGEWNVEFFGSTGQGPTDETLQLQNARDVILGADLDSVGAERDREQEPVRSAGRPAAGLRGLPRQRSERRQRQRVLLSGEQKVGILFKSDVITVLSARLIATNNDFNFGGRPPLEVELTARSNGTTSASCSSRSTRRRSPTRELQPAGPGLDRAQVVPRRLAPTERVLLAGDFNDDVDTSIRSGRASPYKNFVDDAADYVFPTKALSDAGQRTTGAPSQAIDHHLITNELVPFHIAGSAAVYRVDQFVPDYGDTTSDHFPVLTRYTLGGATGERAADHQRDPRQRAGHGTAGEFIEILNLGTSSVDLGGLHAVGRHRRAPHVRGRHHARARPRHRRVRRRVGIPPGVNAVRPSTGALSLNNTSDTATLATAAARSRDSFAYRSSLAGDRRRLHEPQPRRERGRRVCRPHAASARRRRRRAGARTAAASSG